MSNPILSALLLICLVILGINLAHAEVRWQLPEQPLTEGQPFELVLEVDQLRSVTGSPDLTPLKPYMNLLSSRSSFLTERHNGKIHYLSRWTLQLQPRQSGLLQIPAIAVKGEQSPLLQLEVQPRPQRLSERIRLIGELDQTATYPGYPLNLRLQLYYNLPLQRAELTQPRLDGIEFEPIGQQQVYSETLNGRPYQVIEQQYLFMGQQPGDYLLEELTLNATLADGQPLEIRSEPVGFEILTWPDDIAQSPALVASQFQLQQQWPTGEKNLRAGDTLSRTLELVGNDIPAAWLPEPQLEAVAGITVYPQPAQLQQQLVDGILVSRKTIEYKLLLTREGQFQIPDVLLPWWDLAGEKLAIAQVPGRTINVAPFLAAPTDTATEVAPPRVQQDVSNTEPAQEGIGQQTASTWQAWVWALIAFICAAGWTLNWQKRKQLEAKLAAMQTGKRTAPASSVKPNPPVSEHPLSTSKKLSRTDAQFELLVEACRANDPELTHQQLFNWAESQWPQQHIATLVELEQQTQDPTLGYLLRNLEYHAANPHEYWDGELLLERLLRLRRRLLKPKPAMAAPTVVSSARPDQPPKTITKPPRAGSINLTIDD